MSELFNRFTANTTNFTEVKLAADTPLINATAGNLNLAGAV